MDKIYTIEEVDHLIRKLGNRQSEFNKSLSENANTSPVDLYDFFNGKFRGELFSELEQIKNQIKNSCELTQRQHEILQYLTLYLSFSYSGAGSAHGALRKKKIFRYKLQSIEIKEIINWEKVRKPGTSFHKEKASADIEEITPEFLPVEEEKEDSFEEYKELEFEFNTPVHDFDLENYTQEPEEEDRTRSRYENKIRIERILKNLRNLYDKRYAYYPDAEDGFSDSALNDIQSDAHVYILAMTSPDNGIYFISTRENAQKKALNDPDLFITNACENENKLLSGHVILTLKPGSITKKGNKWLITKKAIIDIV